MARKKILIIDDERGFTKLVKEVLENTGKYDVEMENEGRRGIVAAQTIKPDLILLDLIMPDMEGSYVAAEIKKDGSTRDIPIVFLTAVVTEAETHTRGDTIGGHPFLPKPVKIEELINCIEKQIQV